MNRQECRWGYLGCYLFFSCDQTRKNMNGKQETRSQWATSFWHVMYHCSTGLTKYRGRAKNENSRHTTEKFEGLHFGFQSWLSQSLVDLLGERRRRLFLVHTGPLLLLPLLPNGRICRLRASWRANDLKHTGQVNALTPVCRSVCRFWSCWRAKRFGQRGQAKGRSAVCVRLWDFRLYGRVNILLHPSTSQV